MKKFLLALFVLSSVAAVAKMEDTNVYVKLGLDVSSRFKFSNYENLPKKAKSSGGFFLEATNEIVENTEVGFGIGYIGRSGKSVSFYDEDGDYWKIDMPAYDSVPLYFIAKYNFNTGTDFVPYIKADLGYSINRDVKYDIKINGIKVGDSKIKVDNGIYAGIGIGAEYKKFILELSYVHTGAKLKWDDGTKDKYNNGAVRLSVGYKF